MQGGAAKKRGKVVGRSKSKVKKERNKQDEPAMSVKEYDRAQHSKILTKLHKEMQSHLKEIQTKLNALDLDCQLPKPKNRGSNAKCAKEEPNDQSLPEYGIGGKVGKPYFAVQVGEVQNFAQNYQIIFFANLATESIRRAHTGPTRVHEGGGIVRLDESFKVWVDTAMREYNPFVITAMIVCSCGSQVLSETVQEWIKLTSQVRNAPKNHLI
jgi:hypothetical protein